MCSLLSHASTTTIGPEFFPGKKKEKHQVTVFVCTNGAGSERRPLLVIGNSNRPRSFPGKSRKDFMLMYRRKKRTWMRSEVFSDWLLEFDEYISQFCKRHIAIIIDNASCHKKSTDEIRLKNIETFYLPPNTSSLTQPKNAGVIASTKHRFRRKQARHALHVIDKKKNDEYKTDLYTVCSWLCKAWDELECGLIRNFWCLTQVLGV